MNGINMSLVLFCLLLNSIFVKKKPPSSSSLALIRITCRSCEPRTLRPHFALKLLPCILKSDQSVPGASEQAVLNYLAWPLPFLILLSPLSSFRSRRCTLLVFSRRKAGSEA